MSLTQNLNATRELCKMIEQAGVNYSSKINKNLIQSEFNTISTSFKGNLDDVKTEYQFSVAKLCFILYVSRFEQCIYRLFSTVLNHSQETLKSKMTKYNTFPLNLITKTKSDIYPFSKIKELSKKMGGDYPMRIEEIISVRNYLAHGEKEPNDLKKNHNINIINDLDEIHIFAKEVIRYIESLK